MNSDNNNNPEQQVNDVLSKAAVEIKRLEHQRDNPPQGSKPAPRPAPKGAPSFTSAGGNSQARKDYFNNLIGNFKAETLKTVGNISKMMPGDKQKQANDKALGSMYPQDKNDLNQIPTNKQAAKQQGDKEIDNAQERFNQKRADHKQKEAQKQDNKPTRFTQNLNAKQQGQKDQLGKQMDAAKQNKGQNKNGMSTRFTQQLNGNKVQKSDIEPKSVGSMSTRFSQSLGPGAPGDGGAGGGSRGKSGPGKSGPSSPGGKTK